MRNKLRKLIDEKDTLVVDMEKLLSDADATGRSLTDSEQAAFDERKGQLDKLHIAIRNETAYLEGRDGQEGVPDANVLTNERAKRGLGFVGQPSYVPDGPERWMDNNGQVVLALRPQDQLTDYISTDLPQHVRVTRQDMRGSFGRCLKAMVLGDWRHAEQERQILASGSTTSNPGGGWLIPAPLSSEIIDLARSQSVCIAAGARTVPMESSDLTIARLDTDPVVSVKGENDAFADTPPIFDSVMLVSHTVGCFATFSRELVTDAPNCPELLSAVFAKALANTWDNYCLMGTTSQHPIGIVNHPGVNTITSVGAVTYDDLLDAIQKVEEDNHEPRAFVISPAVKNTLGKLVVNSETNHYVSPLPPDVSELRRLVSTQIDDEYCVLGDFSEVLIGIRQDVEISISQEAGETFQRNQVAVRALLRGDVAIARPAALCVLSGIT